MVQRLWKTSVAAMLFALAGAMAAHAQDPPAQPGAQEEPADPAPRDPAPPNSGNDDEAAQGQPASQPRAVAGNRVVQAWPNVLYLLDAQGRWQPVLNLTYEYFERLRNAAILRPPTHRVEHVVVAGAAQGTVARATVTLEAYLQSAEWVRLPVGLANCTLVAAVQYAGPGQWRLEVDELTGEYIVWLLGESDRSHTITLEVLTTLELSPRESRLRLDLPRAVSSEISWTVPAIGLAATVSEGAVLDGVKEEGGATQLHARGVAGDFSLAWRARDAALPAPEPSLHVEGAIRASIGDDGVRTTAVLAIRDHGGNPLPQKLVVRLPRGATLESGGATPHEIKPAAPTSAAPGQPAAAALPPAMEVEFSLAEADEPPRLELSVRQPHQQTDPEAKIDLAGFEIAGAAWQTGTIEVFVDEDWRVTWGEPSQARPTRHTPQPASGAEAPAARLAGRFLYFAQPFSLPVGVAARKPLVRVEPEYDLTVAPGRVQLDGRLVFHVLGGNVDGVEIQLAGWQFDGVGPEDLVDGDSVAVSAEGLLTVPLSRSTNGRWELEFQAHRDLAADVARLELSLPRPMASSVGSARMHATADEGVTLSPRDAESTGLTPQPAEDDGWTYRGDLSTAKFVADYRPLGVDGNSAVASVRSHLSVLATGVRVEQTISYEGATGPVANVELNVPSELATLDSLRVECSGQPMAKANPQPAAASGPISFRLPAGVAGAYALSISYDWPADPAGRAPRDLLRVPLVMPTTPKVAFNRLSLECPAELVVDVRDSAWTRENETGAGGAGVWTSLAPSPGATLGVRATDAGLTAPTVVERAWLQTILTLSGRRDRAVYRFSSRESELRFWLPADVVLEEVLLNGVPAAPQEGAAANERTIALNPTGVGDGHARHLLDVRFRFTQRLPSRGQMTVETLSLHPSVPIRMTYWQVLTPGDEHVVWGPPGFNEEFRWEWKGLFWAREPTKTQAALEAWCGASTELPPPAGMNEYLYSAAEAPPALELRTASRAMMVLAASGVMLALGLAVIYLPGLRRPGAALAACAGLAAAVFGQPATTFLAAQAALLGLALTLLAASTDATLAARRRRTAEYQPPSVVAPRRESTDRHSRGAAPEPMPSTQSLAGPAQEAS